MAAFTLLIAAIASFGGVLLGMAAFPPKNSAYALLFFFLVPAATLIGFVGAIVLTREGPGSDSRKLARVLFAFLISSILGAGLGLMTRL